MKKLLLILIPILILLIIGAFFYNFYQFSRPTVEINGQKFNLLVAKTDKDKQIGLSKYKNLPQDKGMIFIFDKPGSYPFWMKDMKFPIDILFIKQNTIVTSYKNVPINNLTIYTPTESVDKVLEINAGLSDKYNISAGNTVKFKNLK